MKHASRWFLILSVFGPRLRGGLAGQAPAPRARLRRADFAAIRLTPGGLEAMAADGRW
jgi:hypothetical protein